ncbi:MAG: type II secretion system protein [Fusobacterium sp.]|nr:type II secretion system protein [Fusobacterium sp.]
MFRRAFSYIETVVAVFIFLLVLIPTIKINSKQIYTYRKTNEYEKNLRFFNSLTAYIKAKENFKFINEEKKLTFNNYEELIKDKLFEDFSSFDKNKEFILKIRIKSDNVNLFLKTYSLNTIDLEYEDKKDNKINFSDSIIKFKE